VFNKYGDIVNIAIKYQEKEDYTYAFIDFKSSKSAKDALEVNNTEVDDCFLFVSYKTGTFGGDVVGSKTKDVYCEGISADITEEQLKKLLKSK